MINRLSAFFGFEEELSPVALILGPLFLLIAVMMALKVPAAFNYDLVFVAVFGLFLTAKWKIRGCVAALLLLAFSAGAKHVLFPTNHAWQAGLEGSIGIALLISALVFEGSSKWVFSKQSELERNEKTILFLEEDLSQQKELTAKESAAATEKLEGMRLQLEESQSEISALQVLNDVLRKATAKSIEEKEASLAQVLLFNRREGLLLEEIDSLQTELNRLGNESALAQQNKQLFEELNETRVREAQTHLINETLVRLHAKENQKAREFEAKFSAMDDQIQQAAREIEKLNDVQLVRDELQETVYQLNEQIEQILTEKANADLEIGKFSEVRSERDKLMETVQQMEEQLQKAMHEKENAFEAMKEEHSALVEALKKADLALASMQAERNELRQEIELSRQKPSLSVEEKEFFVEQIQTLHTRLEQYRQVELLYRQLKAQFEEKNQILHQTRSELFHADTELQTLKKKLYEKDLEANPMSKEVYTEILSMDEENSLLQLENQELHDLVSHLMQKDEASSSVKKKMKRSPIPSADQASLF